MFSLIAVLTGIVLAVLLVGAALYYGGKAYTNASNEAAVSAIMAQGTQIKAASAVYASDNDGATPTSISVLVTDHYLVSAPKNWNITLSGEPTLYTPVTGTSVCQKFNQKYDNYAANAPVPACTAVSGSQPVCCD